MLLVSSFTVILNETVLSVAIPRLMVDLDVTATTAQWVTTSFLLTMAVVMPTTGTVLQRWPVRAVFVFALSVFTVGTVIAAAAPGFEMLVVGRVVQAVGSALTFPLLVTTILAVVPARRRGSAMGQVAFVVAVGPAVGPTVGGVILSVLSWRWLFGVIAPGVVVCLIVGSIVIGDIGERRPGTIDGVSVALSGVAFGGLIYGLSRIGSQAGFDGAATVAIVGGAAALWAFVYRQRLLAPTGRQLLDLRPFECRPFVLGTAVLAVCMSVRFGVLILLALYLQEVCGLSVLQTGLAVLPGGLMSGAVSPLVGRIFDRHGPRPLVIPGTVLATVASAGLSMCGETTPVVVVAVVYVAASVGFGLILTPVMTAALGCLDVDLYSHGSAIVNTVQQVAAAVGTALFVSVMTLAAGGGSAAGVSIGGIRWGFFGTAVASGVAAAGAFWIGRDRGAPVSVTEL